MTEIMSKDSEYKSHTLSKKEHRLLRKLGKKATEDKKEVKEDKGTKGMDLNILDESDDENEVEDFESEKKEEEEEKEETDDVPYSDVELDDDADVVPHTKLTVNNNAAIKQAYASISIPWEKHPFDESQSIMYHEKVELEIKDIYDDTERELAFFKQGLDAANEGRKKLLALKVPFSRPADYFAEMVKSDEHMEKLRLKLVAEATDKKAKEEAKRQRELKKFGKQVQHETLQQRQKDKHDTLDKIKSLRKKRQNNEIDNKEFDVGVEEASAGKEEVSRKKRRIHNQVMSKSKDKGKQQRPGKSKRRHWKK
ncbi:rRNA-processing protein and EBNA1-binding protein ebp2 [Brettanomyces nanus]|uniref:rRNA-processing protein and EBNA1-binding protein ebp2 n=1 Tax=Eeniella nana TaxID=13502 RepID=A0A875RVT8_EENNA|nr:rRNA-processing protein and EBNA1-binding protein ebp2 [Brettanomyces nanus]QPG72736.1 rRNA-processing protein and EBNA1-binding protein ebp2 [Brettanomyces nanus]